jgi:hypothetical protein
MEQRAESGSHAAEVTWAAGGLDPGARARTPCVRRKETRMLIRQVALVSDTPGLSLRSMAPVAAALQKQVTRDFGPIWEIDATVDAFESLDDVPLGVWPILVGDEGQGGGGVHLDRNHQPFALVDFTRQWTLTASHECLEMIADPFGNRTVAGDSLIESQGRVEFLVEVCDPCEAPRFAYRVNGVLVSDFYTQRFFDPPDPAGTAIRYDFRGHIRAPREVLQGGYVSWRDPVSNHWFQQIFFRGRKEFRDLGVFEGAHASLREWIDGQADEERKKVMNEPGPDAKGRLLHLPGQEAQGEDLVRQSTQARAKTLREQIQKLRGK